MTDEELFATPALQVLEPPPGGLDHLRAAIEHRRPRWWLIAIPAVAAVVVIAIVLAGRVLGPRRAAPQATAQVAPLVADPTIASNDRVSFYWVASQAQPTSAAGRAEPSAGYAQPGAVDPVGQPPQVLIP
jgi:hypothetical protein